MTTMEKLNNNMKKTLVCCGLDPDLDKIPQEITGTDEERVLEFLTGIIDITKNHVCAYKVQKAFFDILDEGHDVLKKVINYIHNQAPYIPVIMDCKIGDIDNTMLVYLKNIFGELKADGILVNPYMGEEVMTPFIDYPEKAVAVLVKTSNPGGAVIQDLKLDNGQILWQKVLEMTTSSWNKAKNLIPVVSSTASMDMSAVSQLIPQETPILLAGVGAQGGSYDDLGLLLNQERSGVFVNSSRVLLYQPKKENETWQDATLRATLDLKSNLEAQR
jgi:orotidine-5'-phosphate decarboxylase